MRRATPCSTPVLEPDRVAADLVAAGFGEPRGWFKLPNLAANLRRYIAQGGEYAEEFQVEPDRWQDEAAIFRINRLLMAEIEGWSVEEGAGFLAIYLPNGWEVEQLSGTRAGSVFSANWSARAPRFWIFAPAS
jgi:hypothetical protein